METFRYIIVELHESESYNRKSGVLPWLTQNDISRGIDDSRILFFTSISGQRKLSVLREELKNLFFIL